MTVPSRRRPVAGPRLAGLAMASLVLAACATSATSRSSWPDPSDADEIRIQVMNNNFSDATLWLVVRGSSRQRLGTVTGKTRQTFTVPWTFPEPLRIEIDLLAGPNCVTRAMDVDPGDVLELEIQPTLENSPACRVP